MGWAEELESKVAAMRRLGVSHAQFQGLVEVVTLGPDPGVVGHDVSAETEEQRLAREKSEYEALLFASSEGA